MRNIILFLVALFAIAQPLAARRASSHRFSMGETRLRKAKKPVEYIYDLKCKRVKGSLSAGSCKFVRHKVK